MKISRAARLLSTLLLSASLIAIWLIQSFPPQFRETFAYGFFIAILMGTIPLALYGLTRIIMAKEPRPAPPQEETVVPAEAEKAKPSPPTKPTGRSWDEWFDYYYQMQEAGLKYTLRDLARDMGYNNGYVRQKKMEYDEARKK